MLNTIDSSIFNLPPIPVVLRAMTENEQILRHALESLRQEFAENNQIEISTIQFSDLPYPGENVISANCSFISSEWEEGIYFDRDRRRYFFYGESPAFSYGGEKRIFAITGHLLSILPPGLLDTLQRIATKGHSEVVHFGKTLLLE